MLGEIYNKQAVSRNVLDFGWILALQDARGISDQVRNCLEIP